jgi:hypothetical protein
VLRISQGRKDTYLAWQKDNEGRKDTYLSWQNEDTAQVSLSNAGIAVKDIITYIRQNSNYLATQKDIYNWLATVRRDAYEGHCGIHALINQLEQEGFWSRIQSSVDGRVTALLLAQENPSELGCI